MSDKERQLLKEERKNLQNVLDFYVNFRGKITSMDELAIDNHIDDILDKLNELKKILDS